MATKFLIFWLRHARKTHFWTISNIQHSPWPLPCVCVSQQPAQNIKIQQNLSRSQHSHSGASATRDACKSSVSTRLNFQQSNLGSKELISYLRIPVLLPSCLDVCLVFTFSTLIWKSFLLALQLKMRSGVLSILIGFIIVSCAQSQCNISEPYQECAALYKMFQKDLFNTSTDNLFLLQSVFYPATRITPALVKVTYNLSITDSCEIVESVSCPSDESTICSSDKLYTFGWTSREIFSIFHPAVINQLRFQLPFWLLQISEDVPFLTNSYNLDALLWEGVRELPSVNLTLDVELTSDNFACECYPTKKLIEQALGELNQWVSLKCVTHGTEFTYTCLPMH